MHSRFVRPLLGLSSGLLLALAATPQAQAQDRSRTPARPATSNASRSSDAPRSSGSSRTSVRPGISSDQPSYRKEFVYGLNFNTRGGLIGGASVRSTHLLTQDWARFWSVEVVEIKHPKEEKAVSNYGGSFVLGKSNSLFAIRPSFGLQRVVFRKAPDSGVQVNALVSGGPSIGLLMPYYISYVYSDPNSPANDLRNEQYDPIIHRDPARIYDRAPLFSGAGEIKPIIGAHLRGALGFEYGRYRDAVAGVEVGVLVEAYTKKPIIIRTLGTDNNSINDQFLPSVYMTIYLGSRN